MPVDPPLESPPRRLESVQGGGGGSDDRGGGVRGFPNSGRLRHGDRRRGKHRVVVHGGRFRDRCDRDRRGRGQGRGPGLGMTPEQQGKDDHGDSHEPGLVAQTADRRLVLRRLLPAARRVFLEPMRERGQLLGEAGSPIGIAAANNTD